MRAKAINADLDEAVAVDTSTLEWQPSPSGTVWRKRLYLDGLAETGRVTSVVRYEPGASFHAHDHPQGEEILVLDGVFSDEHGDWPAGAYLLNPEGFRHSPFSREGCLIFVRLRQHPGRNRQHVSLNTRVMEWKASNTPGIEFKQLWSQQGYRDCSYLERWAPGASRQQRFANGAEIFVLEGAINYGRQSYPKHTWLRFPAGTSPTLTTADNCELYIRSR